VSSSVFLDAEELAALEMLEGAGTHVEVRAVPTEPPLRLPQLKARFAAA
jgi:mannose/fructose/N-acetylgalactosamine-specific phosphotransferase system component IIB